MAWRMLLLVAMFFKMPLEIVDEGIQAIVGVLMGLYELVDSCAQFFDRLGHQNLRAHQQTDIILDLVLVTGERFDNRLNAVKARPAVLAVAVFRHLFSIHCTIEVI
jgi:hypothetical protein